MRLALLAFLAFVVVAVAVACSSSFPRDQYYGTDAGTDFVPPMWDAPGSLPGDGGDDGMSPDAATD